MLNPYVIVRRRLLFPLVERMPRHPAIAEELLARAEGAGYVWGAHKEQVQVKDQRRHTDKTKKNHEGTLQRYIL